jgi:hypothetical protein
VVERLANVLEDIQTMGNIALATHIQTKLHIVGKLGVRLGTFNPKADIATLEISTLAKWV